MISITTATVIAICAFIVGASIPTFIFWKKKELTLAELTKLKNEIRERISKLAERDKKLTGVPVDLEKGKATVH